MQPILGAVIAVSYIEVPMNRLRLMKGRCLLLVLLPLILLVACDDGVRQRLQLEELERMNRADSLMTNDSLALDLAEWFDDHGTPNEQMRAYYILGRTYADLGEAPQAIEAYNDAADRADTIDADCDYKTLAKVYAQMSTIYYNQNLMEDYLNCLQSSSVNALKANDTLMALKEKAYMMAGYDRLEEDDSLLSIFYNIYSGFNRLGEKQRAAQYCVMPVKSLLRKSRTEEAKSYLDIYEAYSGYFNNGRVMKGREVFYYYKGMYYLAVNKYDSAEYYFRRELLWGTDYNNQNAASKGLAKLFTLTHRPDSAAKYAIYSYDMIDSVYAQMAINEVEQMAGMYNYSRFQRKAHIEKQRADNARLNSRILLFILIIAAIISLNIYNSLKRKRKIVHTRYANRMKQLAAAQSDIIMLRSHEREFSRLLQEKEKTIEGKDEELSSLRQHHTELINQISEKKLFIETLQSEIAKYQGRMLHTNKTAESRLQESTVYKSLIKKADKGKVLTTEEWDELISLVIEVLPGYFQFLSNNQYILNPKEYRMCVLLRLHVNARSAGNLIGVSPSSVTKMSKNVSKAIFERELTAKDLITELMEIA